LSFGGADIYKQRLSGDQGNLLKDTLQDATSVGSFAVPGMGAFTGSLPKVLAGGALAGGMQGFGGSDLESGDTLSDIVTGAGFGAGTAGVFHGLGKLISKAKGVTGAIDDVGAKGAVQAGNKVQEAGKNLRQSILEVDPTKLTKSRSYKGISGANKLVDDTFNILDDLKLKSGTRTQLAESVGVGNKLLGKKLESQLSMAGEALNPENIVGKVETLFKDNSGLLRNSKGVLKPDVQEWFSKIRSTGGSVKGLSGIKSELDGMINYARGGQTPKLERIFRGVRQAIDGEIKSIAQKTGNTTLGKEIESTLRRMSILHEVTPFTLKNLKDGTQLGSSLLGTKLDISPVTDRIRTKIGEIVQKGVNTSGVQNALGGDLMGTAQGLGSKYGSPIAANLFNGQSAIQSPMGFGQTEIPETTMAGLGQTETSGVDQDQRTQVALQLLGQGMKPSDVKTTLELVGLGASKAGGLESLSMNERKTYSQAASGYQALQNIANMLSDEGAFGGTQLGALLPDFMRPGESKQLASEIERAAEMFGRMQSGGAISQQEEDRFKRLLPGVSDDPETRQAKLQALMEQFSVVLNSAQMGNPQQQVSAQSLSGLGMY